MNGEAIIDTKDSRAIFRMDIAFLTVSKYLGPTGDLLQDPGPGLAEGLARVAKWHCKGVAIATGLLGVL